MEEEWRDIPGYEGCYQVSDHGNVRSLDRSWKQKSRWGTFYQHHKKGRLLRPGLTGVGYPSVVLGRKGTWLVHSLVALAFIGPRPERFDVCHKDGSRNNNHLDNLEYGSRTFNNQEAVFHGRRKLSVEDIKRIRKSTKTHEATGIEFGISTGFAWAVKNRKAYVSID